CNIIISIKILRRVSMKKNKIILMILIFTMIMPSLAFANNNPTEDVISELQNKEQGPLGSVQNEVSRFSRDIFNIVRLVVVAVLIISLFMNLAAFSKAGDNPGLKAALKTKMIWSGVGAILAINFWRIIELFNSITLLE